MADIAKQERSEEAIAEELAAAFCELVMPPIDRATGAMDQFVYVHCHSIILDRLNPGETGDGRKKKKTKKKKKKKDSQF
jgi:hypothetical protein